MTAGQADALELARRGWAVLPLNGKVPITAHGVKDASSDPDRVVGWWPGGARHNIGARVPAHLVVLDIDPQNGGSLDALVDIAGGALPQTLTVHSGRGTGGRHLYFQRPPGRLTSRRLPPGIDVKTDQGYCVLPPSTHPATGAPYRWEAAAPAVLPAALSAAVVDQPRADRRAVFRPAVTGNRLQQKAGHLATYVQGLAEGNRNSGLFWAACEAVRDGHPDETFDLLEAAATIAGLDEHEARRTILSARRKEQRS